MYAYTYSNIYMLYVQGGSDISGTLSKLHRGNKKSYFLLIISRKTGLALFRSGNKKNRHIPANINQQKATRAVIVSRVRAGLTVIKMISIKTSKGTLFKT
jgi:hypothetical protein